MFYFWPLLIVASLLVFFLFLVLLSVNFVLGLLVISLYGLIPKKLLFDVVGRLLQNSRVEENIRATFQLHLSYLPPSGSLFVWSPHGLFSVSSAMFNSLAIAKHEKYTPNKVASLSLFHYIPVLNDIASYLDNIPSDYQSIKQTIQSGHSVSIMLGGVREMTNVEPCKIKVYVKKRIGVFRISLETEKPIIPILTYGENELFEPVKNYYTNVLNDFLHKWFGISIPFVTLNSLYRWYQLSYKPLDVIHSYVGDPIIPRKDDTIETLRNRYIDSIKKLFRKTAPLKYTLHIQ